MINSAASPPVSRVRECRSNSIRSGQNCEQDLPQILHFGESVHLFLSPKADVFGCDRPIKSFEVAPKGTDFSLQGKKRQRKAKG